MNHKGLAIGLGVFFAVAIVSAVVAVIVTRSSDDDDGEPLSKGDMDPHVGDQTGVAVDPNGKDRNGDHHDPDPADPGDPPGASPGGDPDNPKPKPKPHKPSDKLTNFVLQSIVKPHKNYTENLPKGTKSVLRSVDHNPFDMKGVHCVIFNTEKHGPSVSQLSFFKASGVNNPFTIREFRKYDMPSETASSSMSVYDMFRGKNMFILVGYFAEIGADNIRYFFSEPGSDTIKDVTDIATFTPLSFLTADRRGRNIALGHQSIGNTIGYYSIGNSDPPPKSTVHYNDVNFIEGDHYTTVRAADGLVFVRSMGKEDTILGFRIGNSTATENFYKEGGSSTIPKYTRTDFAHNPLPGTVHDLIMFRGTNITMIRANSSIRKTLDLSKFSHGAYTGDNFMAIESCSNVIAVCGRSPTDLTKGLILIVTYDQTTGVIHSDHAQEIEFEMSSHAFDRVHRIAMTDRPNQHTITLCIPMYGGSMAKYVWDYSSSKKK